MHVVSDSAPHEDEYFPAPHFMQSEAASPAYFPASQSQHSLAEEAPIIGEYLPAVHNTQSDSASFPVVAKYFPVLQLAQPELPTVAEYFPASHSSQSEAPVFDHVPAGHG